MSNAKAIIVLAAILLLTPIASGCAKPPVIAFSSSSFSFTVLEGFANPPSQTLNIWNAGEGTLSWSVSSSASWLQLSPSNGTSTGESDSITLSADIGEMSAGNYTAIITIVASKASNSPETVAVDLTIFNESDVIVESWDYQITYSAARNEATTVQTAILAGMANASVGTVTAGTVTAGATSVTISYMGGSFQLGDYLHLPTHGTWSWDSTGMVVSGTYSLEEFGVTCTLSNYSTWECTK